MRILVVGATGLIGRPVATQLLSDGFEVRLLVRDAHRARSRLGEGFEYVEGDVGDKTSVARAVRGCRGVHVSLAGTGPEDLDRIEGQGTGHIARAAADSGVELLTYLTGSLVHENYGEKIAEHRAKLAAEEAVSQSGVPFVFFRPTYFMDNLPRHVQGRFAVVPGRPKPLHMVAATDFARMVSRAFQVPDVAERNRLRANLEVMALLQRLGERGDPAEANRLLGAPTTTVGQWCERQAASRAAG
jgi:uncharacterized protein YbjT (DUF2867 family)